MKQMQCMSGDQPENMERGVALSSRGREVNGYMRFLLPLAIFAARRRDLVDGKKCVVAVDPAQIHAGLAGQTPVQSRLEHRGPGEGSI
jgi:hypothetical protein